MIWRAVRGNRAARQGEGGFNIVDRSEDCVEVLRNSQAVDHAAPTIGELFAAAKRLICEKAAEAATGAFGDTLRALILTGSLARDEATIVEKNGAIELLGDAEFLLVFAEGVTLPDLDAIHDLQKEIESRLAHEGLHVSLDLAAVHPGFLRRMTPRIFAYELRACGQVAWGDQQVLTLIPAFSTSDILLEDAWRLLSNRMIELLEVATELASRPDPLPQNVQYRTVKLYQDMATSFLVFVRAYEPTYRGRAERLKALAADRLNGDPPFSLLTFSNRVSVCTNFKLRGYQDAPPGEIADCPAGMAFWEDAVSQAHALWRWELMRLTQRHGPLSDGELMKAWMKMQPLRDRARGWAHVLRKCGWHRSWRMWPRWLRLGWTASPRYCVYAAASRLFFQLPDVLGVAAQTAGAGVDCSKIFSLLPEDHTEPDMTAAGWRRAIRQITANYKLFLEGTRA